MTMIHHPSIDSISLCFFLSYFLSFSIHLLHSLATLCSYSSNRRLIYRILIHNPHFRVSEKENEQQAEFELLVHDGFDQFTELGFLCFYGLDSLLRLEILGRCFTWEVYLVKSSLHSMFSPTEAGEIPCEPGLRWDAGAMWAEFTANDDSDNSSDLTQENQTCTVSDYVISDMIVMGLTFQGGTETTFADVDSAVYNSVNTDLLFDMICDAVEPTSNDDEAQSSLESIGNIDTDTSSLYVAVHESDISSFANYDQDRCSSHQWDLASFPESMSSNLSTELQEVPKRKSVTLVLDLDETLIHSSFERCDDVDFNFPVFFDDKKLTVYVRQRPYLKVFLEMVSEMFEVVIFTASQSIYAKQLLDILDPDGNIFSQRFYRESCIFTKGCYIKDLTILGVDLAKVAIIDNTPEVFQLQVNNGIPIKSWFDDPSDRELLLLYPLLETIVDAEDVRPIISKKFGNKN